MNAKAGYDVIVLGSGIAGLAAALAAAEKGMRPLVIEKSPKLGGGTTNSWGAIWVGDNHLAQAAGYKDSREDTITYMKFLAGGEAFDDHLLAYVDRSPEVLKFFEKCGVSFRIVKGLKDHYYGVAPASRIEGRSLEAELISGHALGAWQHKVHVPQMLAAYVTLEEMIAWGGMQRVSEWDPKLVEARKAEDMRGKGAGLICHFVKALIDRKVEMRVGEQVRRLMFDGERVHGVVTSSGEEIAARAGVVLATGGYESNPALVDNYEKLPRWVSQCPPANMGDGLLLGTEIGAASHMIRNNMQLFLAYGVPMDAVGAEPPVQLAGIIELFSPHTMVVNARGQRFADESFFQRMIPGLRYFDPMTHSYPNLPCYLIFDQQFADRYSIGGAAPGTPVPQWVSRADDLKGLARKLDIDGDGLAKTVERFNGFSASGHDPDFGRGALAWRLAAADSPEGTNPSLGPLTKAPYYGVELKPAGSSSVGLLTNVDGQVVHQRQHPIPGLYCTGNTAARVEFGAGYQAGYTLASGMTFSYLAVEHMARAA